MCDPAGAAKGYLSLPALIKNVKDPLKHIQPDAPKFPRLKKPPVVPDPSVDISLAAQHAKEAAIGAYGASDTMLTGGKGLGSAGPKNLWKLIGSSG